MAYKTIFEPRWHDKRTQNRVKKALGMSLAVLSADKGKAVGTRFIDKHFGVQSNPLSKWLRQKLLICTNRVWNHDKGKCKEWMLNMDGVNFCLEMVDDKDFIYDPKQVDLHAMAIEWTQQEFSAELETGKFEYKLQSNRHWHPLQNISRDQRTAVMENNEMGFEYDIDSAAPNLIYQYSRQLPWVYGKTPTGRKKLIAGPNTEVLDTLEYYLEEKQFVREQLAKSLQLDIATVKKMISAFLMGGTLAPNKHSSVYEIIDSNYNTYLKVKNNAFLISLREDIKIMWNYIREHWKATTPFRDRTYTNKQGETRSIRFNARIKMGIYFELERQVMAEVVDYLHLTNNKHFLVHDGFYSSNEINTDVLSRFVEDNTGFSVTFS